MEKLTEKAQKNNQIKEESGYSFQEEFKPFVLKEN